MTSKFKGQTENTPPLSYAGSTGEKAQPSSRSAVTTTEAKATQPMTIMPTTSKDTLTTGAKGKPSERTLLSATILKAAFLRLKKDGFVKLYRVLSPDKTTVTKIIMELPAEFWTESLDFRLLSEQTTEAK